MSDVLITMTGDDYDKVVAKARSLAIDDAVKVVREEIELKQLNLECQVRYTDQYNRCEHAILVLKHVVSRLEALKEAKP